MKTEKALQISNEIHHLIELSSIERLEGPRKKLENMVNTFVDQYDFAYLSDRESFITKLKIEQVENYFQVQLKTIQNRPNGLGKHMRGALKISIDGTIIHEPKTTDTFEKAIQLIGVDHIKALNLHMLKMPLIADYRHQKYTQRIIADNAYLLTALPNTKKKEVLEKIGGRLNLKVEVEINKY